MALLDTGQLAALYDLAGSETGEMLESFADSTRSALDQLSGLLASGESAEMLELVHQIKGGAATMGLAALEGKVGACEDLMRAGKSVNPLEIGNWRPLLEESVVEVRRILASS